MESDNICIHCTISGRVQGVFFRDSTQKKATELAITGWVRNLPDGRVEVVAYGPKENIEQFETWLWMGPPAANVTNVEKKLINLQEEFKRFEIRYE